jgi:2-oxo-4-hydroxy-4-carboxy-5-ureidoimidazoline decarboxylase
MTLAELNQANKLNLIRELMRCCGSLNWAAQLADQRPYPSKQELLIASDRIWSACTKSDGLEAFSHHPKIGDTASLKKKFASTSEWAGGEQAGVQSATEQTIVDLAKGNEAYEHKFGYIFIVCATGKTAEEMLVLLNARIGNTPDVEFEIAKQEQNKITHLRLEKLIP